MAELQYTDFDSLSLNQSSEMEYYQREYVMVAAIDFGTTYSGYAFSFKNKPQNIVANKNWGDELGAASYKAPTSVLVNDRGEFVSFGYKAEHDYTTVCTTDEGDGYNLFRHFKMMLYHEKNLSLSTRIKSTAGNNFSAISVFAMALKYLKDHLLEAVSRQVKSAPDASIIKWVLTIPAIWNDQAKQFMREAASLAGLISSKDSKQLLLALEPEAASVLCRSLDIEQFSTDIDAVSFPPGTKYMIIDAGGGTVDITAHQILDDGNLEEIMCASGGNWGGNQVDKNFTQLLETILGAYFIKVYKSECPSEWLNLMTDFEKKKKGTNMSDDVGINITLSWSIAAKFSEVTQGNIEKAVLKASSEGVSLRHGSLVISHSTVMKLFTPVIENISNHVKTELEKNENLVNLDYILLVGGFGESKILAENLKQEFAEKAAIICPHAAGLAIVKGAVLFGHEPKMITARIARKTYGYAVNTAFEEGVHNQLKQFLNEDGISYCSDIFKPVVLKDEKVSVNEKKTFYVLPQKAKDTVVGFHLYSSEVENVMYTDEDGVIELGRLKLNIPLVPGVARSERNIRITVYFGHTEIEFEFEDKSRKDGEVVKTTIDFLN